MFSSFFYSPFFCFLASSKEDPVAAKQANDMAAQLEKALAELEAQANAKESMEAKVRIKKQQRGIIISIAEWHCYHRRFSTNG